MAWAACKESSLQSGKLFWRSIDYSAKISPWRSTAATKASIVFHNFMKRQLREVAAFTELFVQA